MVKNMLTRNLEESGDWISCNSNVRDRYLLESSALNPTGR